MSGTDDNLLDSFGERKLLDLFAYRLLLDSDNDAEIDDCAIIDLDSAHKLVFTIDAGPSRPFMKRFQIGTDEDVGHFSATMTLSDIAAMGAMPRSLVAACVFPRETTSTEFASMLGGIAAACKELGCAFSGGDTKEGQQFRIITAGIGILEQEPLLRRNAKPGQMIAVSGALGHVLRSYVDASRSQGDQRRSVLRPSAKVEFGRWLARTGISKCCIDLSDGPAAGAKAIAESSGVHLQLDADAMPLAPAPDRVSDELWTSFLMSCGGEYELMFTCDADRVGEVVANGGAVCGSVLDRYEGGKVDYVNQRDGVEIHSWEHFASTSWVTETLDKIMRGIK